MGVDIKKPGEEYEHWKAPTADSGADTQKKPTTMQGHVEWYINRVKDMGMDQKTAQTYLKTVIRDLKNSAADTNPKTNPDLVQLEGYNAAGYLALANAVEKAAQDQSLL